MSQALRCVLLAGLLLCLAPTFAGAAGVENFMNGETTLVFMPTVDTIPYQTVTGSMTWIETDPGSTFPLLNVAYGASPQLEVGLGYGGLDPEGPGDDLNQWHLFGKYRFMDEMKDGYGLAVEGRYQDLDGADGFGLHVLGSTRLNRPEDGYLLRAHGMIGWQDFSADAPLGDIDDVLLGIGVQYLRPDGWEAGVEYILDNDITGDDVFSANVRYAFRPEWDANVGFGNDSRFFVGVRYKFMARK